MTKQSSIQTAQSTPEETSPGAVVFGTKPAAPEEPKPAKKRFPYTPGDGRGPLPNSLPSRLADGRAKKEYVVKGKKVPLTVPWSRCGRPKGAKNLTKPEIKKFELRQYTPQVYRAVVNMFKEGIPYDEVLRVTNLHPLAIDAIREDYEHSSKAFNEASRAHAAMHAKRCIECRNQVADFCRPCAESIAKDPDLIEHKENEAPEIEVLDLRAP